MHTSKQYIYGYLLSVVLTAAALLLVVSHTLALLPLIIVLLLLATMQIFVQLFFFMHVLEGKGPAYHVLALGIALFFTVAIVGGSIWIMAFNSQVA